MLTKSHKLTLRRTPPERNRLRKAIELAVVTQHEVAFGVKASPSYISDLVNGCYRSLTVRNAHRFASFFNCRIEDLFPEGSDVETEHEQGHREVEDKNAFYRSLNDDK